MKNESTLPIKCLTCTEHNCLISKYCSSNWLSIIDSKKGQLSYKKGQYIFYQGYQVFGIYFINQGKVKVITTGKDDRERIVRLATNGDILGHRGYAVDTYSVSAVALEDSVVCFIDNEMIYEAFMANPKLLYNLMVFYSQELRKSETRMRLMSEMNIRDKIVNALVYLIEIFGIDPKERKLDVAISRQEIASLAGTYAEQVSRTITGLKEKNIIMTNGRKIVINDYQGLKEIINKYET